MTTIPNTQHRSRSNTTQANQQNAPQTPDHNPPRLPRLPSIRLSQFGSVQSHLALLTETLGSYNGGDWGLLMLANRVNNAQSAIQGARLNLDQLPVLSGDYFGNWAGSYEELQPVIPGALQSAHGKICPPSPFPFLAND